MKFFDPARPRLFHDTPCYNSSKGRLTPLPHVSVFPLEGANGACAGWDARVWVPSNGQGSREFSFTCKYADVTDLTAMLAAYAADPEWALAHYFGYEGPQGTLVGAPIDPALLGL